MDFEELLNPPNILNLQERGRRPDDLKQYQKGIRYADGLLALEILSDPERECFQKFKDGAESVSSLLLARRRKNALELDPIKETLLNFAARRTLLSSHPEGWTEAYRECIGGDMVCTRRKLGRPKKIFLKALLVVIFKLLAKKNISVKRRSIDTATIISQRFGMKLTEKDVEHARHDYF
jgi:hypothetical protein